METGTHNHCAKGAFQCGVVLEKNNQIRSQNNLCSDPTSATPQMMPWMVFTRVDLCLEVTGLDKVSE